MARQYLDLLTSAILLSSLLLSANMSTAWAKNVNGMHSFSAIGYVMLLQIGKA